jgi:AraC family transcriptional activator of mtrCDE
MPERIRVQDAGAQEASDRLSGFASLLRVRPELDDLCRFGGSWASPHVGAAPGWAYFHIVMQGCATVDRSGHDPLSLRPGDVLLLPHGDPHVIRASLTDGSAGRTASTHHNDVRIRVSIGVEHDIELVCGRLYFEDASESLILAALPDVMVLQVGESVLQARYKPLLHGIREELAGAHPGALAIARNLAGALFVMMLRAHLNAAGGAAGVFQLLSRPVTARALMAMMADPVRAWSLDELANTAAMSRASLVRAFHKAGAPAPLSFLTELRLAIARRRLSDGSASVERIAAEVGYQSQAAFSRAFMRKYGVRPGKLRTDAQNALGSMSECPLVTPTAE